MKKYINYLCALSIFPLALVAVLKVSSSYEDYFFLNSLEDSSSGDSILEKNITELIESWPGFKAEEYYITTEDGYRLLVDRSYSKITQKHPIILVHGLASNAFGWVNRGNVSYARVLGDLGYDVWMLNCRGTWYSKGHVNLTASDKNYWKFTVDHLGAHDVRSVIQFVAEQTNRQAIYMGYSMGTTSFLMYSSTFSEEAEQNIKAMVALAPYMNYKDAKTLSVYVFPIWPLLKRLIYILWNGEILPGYSVFLKPLVQFPGGMYIIQFFGSLIFGHSYDQVHPLTFPQFATQQIDTAGVEVFSQFRQIYHTSVFKKYDYGRDENLEIYGTPTPPVYDLSKIPVPVAIFTSENDWLASLENAQQIYSEIQPSLRCGFQVIPFKTWNHLDFMIAKDLSKYLYQHLFEKLAELGDGVCHQKNIPILGN